MGNLKHYGWAFGFAAAALLWLLGARNHAHDQRLFWGLWRTSSLLLGVGLGWLSLVSLVAAHSRQALLRLLALSFGLALVLLMAETASWILPEGLWPRRRGAGLGTERLMGVSRSGEAYQDTFTRWGIPSDPIGFEYCTDRRGFRHTSDYENPGIVLLGDSILVSALLPFDQTLTALIDSKLNAQVANVALIGIGPQQQLNLLRESMAKLKGKLVVQFIFEGNDLLDSRKFRAVEPDGKLDAKYHSFIYPLLMRAQRFTDPIDPVAHRQMGTIGGQNFAFLWRRSSFEGAEPEIPHLLESLTATRRFVEGLGGRYAVALVPAKIRVLGPLCTFPAGSNLVPVEFHLNPLRDALHHWAGIQEVPLRDLSRALIAAGRMGSIPYFPGDTHPNAAGHAAMAESLLSWDVLINR